MPRFRMKHALMILPAIAVCASAGAAQDATVSLAPRADSPPEAAQAQAAYREPGTAFKYAFLAPGGGHLYSGEKRKGITLLGIAAGSLIGGALLSGDDGGGYNPELTGASPDGPGNKPLLIGAGIAGACWIYGIIDSRASADRMNERRRLELQVSGTALEVQPWLAPSAEGPSAGLNFRLTW